MNHSMYSADQMTHLKIVVIVLVAGIEVAGFRNRGSYQNRRRIHPDSASHQSESATSRQKVCACSAER